MRDDERGPLELLDRPGHRRRLAGARRAEHRLEAVAGGDRLGDLLDRARLVAHGRVQVGRLERALHPASVAAHRSRPCRAETNSLRSRRTRCRRPRPRQRRYRSRSSPVSSRPVAGKAPARERDEIVEPAAKLARVPTRPAVDTARDDRAPRRTECRCCRGPRVPLEPHDVSGVHLPEPHPVGSVHASPRTRGRGHTPRALELAYATRRAWLEPGKHIVVREAPTSFGPVSFTITSLEKHVRIRVDVPGRAPLRTLRLRLRLPRGHIAAVTLGGRPYTRFDARTQTIDLPRRPGRVDLVVRLA